MKKKFDYRTCSETEMNRHEIKEIIIAVLSALLILIVGIIFLIYIRG